MPLDPRPRFSVSHYLTEPTIYRRWFFPELENALGPLWPLILIVAVAAVVFIAVRSRNKILRVLAVGPNGWLGNWGLAARCASGDGSRVPMRSGSWASATWWCTRACTTPVAWVCIEAMAAGEPVVCWTSVVLEHT